MLADVHGSADFVNLVIGIRPLGFYVGNGREKAEQLMGGLDEDKPRSVIASSQQVAILCFKCT